MRYSIPSLVAAVLVLGVAGALVAGGATSAAAFSAFNPNWDGTSELRSTAESEGATPVIMRNTSTYDNYGDGDVAFILAPEGAYSDGETRRIRRFIERGGTLVVANRDGAAGNELLASVGADARPMGPLLRDDQENYRSPALPVATNVSNHSLVADVPSLTLNYGTAVEPNNATVLISSSDYSYLDRDDSGTRTGDERVQSHPVATIESIGDGRIVVVGDPSVFINAMQDQPGNEQFTRALVADADNALVDVSKSSLPPLVAALLAIRESALLQVLVGLVGLAAVATTGRIIERRRPNHDPIATDTEPRSDD